MCVGGWVGVGVGVGVCVCVCGCGCVMHCGKPMHVHHHFYLSCIYC